MDFNLATVIEAVAAGVPDREALVSGELRLTYGQLAERSRRLANHLLANGFRVNEERSELEGWESGQDHLALYLHNGNEYVEGMLGAYRARVAPFNVNYRYVAEELRYLLQDSGAKGVIYHSAFAPTLDEVRGELPGLDTLLQVADDSGNDAAPRRDLVRGRAGRGVVRAAADRALTRRPLHPLHRRHDRHAQGCAVAPGRHLPGGDGRAAAGHVRRVVRPRRDRGERPQRRSPPHAGPPVHARRRALVGVQRARRRQHARAPPPPAEPRRGRRLDDDPGRVGQHPADRRRRVRSPAGRRARAPRLRHELDADGGQWRSRAQLGREEPHPRAAAERRRHGRARRVGDRPAGHPDQRSRGRGHDRHLHAQPGHVHRQRGPLDGGPGHRSAARLAGPEGSGAARVPG